MAKKYLLGARLKLNEQVFHMPLKMVLATSYRPMPRLLTAVGIQKTGGRRVELQPAVEFELVPETLYLRESYSTHSEAYRLGFTLRFSKLHVDYFYALNNRLGNANSLGVRWKMQ